MSGICGIVFNDKNNRLSQGDVLSLVQALKVSEQGDSFATTLESVGIGAQGFPGRLTGIAERELQGQPLVMAFHGTLYNLKDWVPAKNQSTEVISELLMLYTKKGMDFLQGLRGEFSLAIWDGRKEALYLATDRFRVHPLLYYQDSDKLVFASRMKGILACPFPIKRTIHPEAIVEVTGASIIPTPKTIFREVKKLPPGYFLTYQRGEVYLEPYWEIHFRLPSTAIESELAKELKTRFTEAVSVRLEVDGMSNQIGTFLSGGVDSSTVTGVLTQLIQHPVKSFSIGFEEQRFNEINYARIAARAFGAKHYEYFVSPRDAYDAIPILLEGFDEPYGNASAIPTYFCAKMAREQGVDILYAGDGGDELFAGNERYATQRLFEYYSMIPGGFREFLIKPLVFALADRWKWDLFLKGKKYIQRASIPYPARLSSYGFFQVIPLAELLEDSLLEAVGRDYDLSATVNSCYFQAPARSELDRQLYIDLKLAISDNDLFKVTRMTEAVGITVRFPFLDHILAEFAMRIPASVKMRGRQLRSFFKKAYSDLLPPETRAKKKHGFGLPIPVWLRTDKRLNEMMQDLVLSPRSIQRGYFKKRTLEKMVELHKTDETSFYGTALWNLMILELWHRKNIGS
ncbi:MAG TPA: asparagine synthase (glutamine-hydrolyzing) [Candidatus Limnocylindrales bacterium]|nr:asparagine synthase (glutamine-hydrolyzing) [Candidatus Limnocylindrales bacterium]